MYSIPTANIAPADLWIVELSSDAGRRTHFLLDFLHQHSLVAGFHLHPVECVRVEFGKALLIIKALIDERVVELLELNTSE